MIRVAVIGAGHWGPNLIRNFHDHEHSEVAYVVDQNPARLALIEARFPGVRTSADPAIAIADPAVDAVVIATPTSTHHPLAKSALEHGKHVLVEKPITSRTADAEELCALAEHAQRQLMVGHVFLFNPGIRRVKDMLDAGELGRRIHYVSATRTNLGPIRLDVDAAWDLAAHDISIVNWWLGAEPVTASATGGSWINAGIYDAVFATLRYPNDVLAHLHASWLNPRKTRLIAVVGDARMCTFDDMNLDEPVRVYDKRVTDERTYTDTFASFRTGLREGDIVIPRVVMGEPLKAECQHFLECIRSGTPPITDGRSGLAVVRALAAIERSVKGGGHEVTV